MHIADLYLPNTQTVAYRLTGMEIAPLPATGGEPTRPFEFLMPVGGTVRVPGGQAFDIERPGLYRVYDTVLDRRVQWIVHDLDIGLFAASVSSLLYHQPNEPDDASRSMGERRALQLKHAIAAAKEGKVGVTCLTAANVFAACCRSAGVEAVVWEFENVSTPYERFATHAMAEARDAGTGKSVLYDIDRGLVLHLGDDEPLSCEAFVEAAQRGDAIRTTRISPRAYAGFGAGSRHATVEDFVSDLYEFGGSAFDESFYAIIGTSELVLGTKAYGEGGKVTSPAAAARSREALAPDDARRRRVLEMMREYPASDFLG